MLQATDYARFQPPPADDIDLTNVTAWIDLSGADIRGVCALYDCRVKIRGTGGDAYEVEQINVECGAEWRQLDERHPFEAALAKEIIWRITDEQAALALADAYWEA